jgi:two-component system sensor histidine kinase VanS
VDRTPGLSVRLKLTLSYAGFLMLAGALMLAAAWFAGQDRQAFDALLQYVPDGAISAIGGLVPGNSSFLLRAFAPAAAIALAFLLVFGLVGGWILAGRMLAPLARITDATRVAATGSLSHRIELEGRKDEFRELADTFDAMLARLEAHVAEQQRFAANASHELRTPLAITQTLLDVARNDLNHDTGELVDRLHAVNARAIDLTEALLVLSRADQRSFTREHVDLSLIAEETAETLLPLAERRGLTIETSGDMTPTVGSHALLLQLSTNLVHNAIVHNLPEQGTVWVTTSIHAERVVLTVENTGEQLTPQLVATLAEPFRRGTERLRTEHAGVGLGLAIVKSITQAHDGTLTLTPRAAGGLCVTVQLPARHPSNWVLGSAAPERRVQGAVGVEADAAAQGSPTAGALPAGEGPALGRHGAEVVRLVGVEAPGARLRAGE